MKNFSLFFRPGFTECTCAVPSRRTSFANGMHHFLYCAWPEVAHPLVLVSGQNPNISIIDGLRGESKTDVFCFSSRVSIGKTLTPSNKM